MATITHPPGRAVDSGYCQPTFEAEPYTKESLSSYDEPAVDGRGQHSMMGDHLAAQGVQLSMQQWEVLADIPNPNWTATYQRVILGSDGKPIDPGDTAAIEEATTTHQVADCPTCGTPVKVEE